MNAGDLDDDGFGGGVHVITRKTNQWFDREVDRLERGAQKWAADWAERGLPRHDLERSGALEVEQVLAGRCVEAFRQWTDRVRVKMADAIARESESLGSQIGELQGATGRAQQIGAEIEGIDARVAELRVASSQTSFVPVVFQPIVDGRAFFWSFAIALTMVEFFANFPVFRLLLPMNAALARAAESAVEEASSGEWWSGFALQLKEIALHSDALVVALVAVLMLVLFGKMFGASWRFVLALDSREHPHASTTFRAIRRQHAAAILACTLGAGAILGFLYVSRQRVEGIAAQRAAADSVELARLQQTRSVGGTGATDFAAIARTNQRIQSVSRSLNLHRDDRAYATTVAQNDAPLLALNLGLFVAAGLVGFLTRSGMVADGKGDHPAISRLCQDRRKLQREAQKVRKQGRAAELIGGAGIARVEHLIRSSPLAEWKAKSDRLSGVIPLFRGENARLRGLDSGSILAFSRPTPLDLPVLEAAQGFAEPVHFARQKLEFDAARQAFAAALSRIPINPTAPTAV